MAFNQTRRPLNNGRHVDYANRGYNGGYNTNNNARFSPRKTQRPQPQGKEMLRGIFEIISINDRGQQIVGIETGYKNDMRKLAEGLGGYASFTKVGIDDMERDTVFACRHGDQWHRCRMVSRHGPGGFVVDLIDSGGQLNVGRGDLIILSQLYRDWSVKSTNISFANHDISSDASTEGKAQQRLVELMLNRSFQISYNLERTGPTSRDRLVVVEMKHQESGESVIDKLVEEGLLVKKQLQPQPFQNPDRPPSQQSSNSWSGHCDRVPLRAQRPITKSGHGTQRIEPRSRAQFEPGTNQDGPRSLTIDQHLPNGNPAPGNGWGNVELCRDDTGADHWASTPPSAPPAEDRKKSPVLDWAAVDQRENEDPQTQWGAGTKKWTASDWNSATAQANAGEPMACQQPQQQGQQQLQQQAQPSQKRAQQNNVRPDGGNPEVAVSPRQSTSSGQNPRRPSDGQRPERFKDDVFSSAGDWADTNNVPAPPKAIDIHKAVEDLNLSGESSSGDCGRCVQLTNKVNALESSLYGPAVQKLISTRLSNITTELRQVKFNLAQLRLDPNTQNDEAVRNALAHSRWEGRVRVKEAAELLQTASAETLASFGMNGWSQFVGIIWAPMMDLQYLDENTLCVHKGTVVRRVVLEDDSVEPAQRTAPSRETVVLERAIEIPRMFPVLQDLASNKARARVESVFFSEDNSKVYLQLEAPAGPDTDLEQFAKEAIASLMDLGIID